VLASAFIKSGGAANEVLMADGSVRTDFVTSAGAKATSVDHTATPEVSVETKDGKPIFSFKIPKGVPGKDGSDGKNGSQGPQGPTGPQGPQGDPGEDGQDGVGISTVTINENNELVVTLSNGTPINLGNVKGDKGDTGADGKDGDKGDTGPQGLQGEQGPQGETGATGATGPQGSAGITPRLRVGEDNYWYVSYDNGTTWASLNVKATGANG
jgi:hypothetical protein